MAEPIRRTPDGANRAMDSSTPVMWRREFNRQRKVALKLAREYQVSDKAKRSKNHNEKLSPSERRSLPRIERSDLIQDKYQQEDEGAALTETRINEANQV